MGNKLLSGKIEFIQYHKPGLLSGDYLVEVSQKIEVGLAEGKIADRNIFGNKRSFTVAGPRFQLVPQDIYAVFPPPGSVGEHSNVLPHVIFNRSTLPWEREIWQGSESADAKPAQSTDAKSAGSSASWLALLVFHQDDIESGRVSQPKVITVEKLLSGTERAWHLDAQLADTGDPALFRKTTAMPALVRGSDQHADDRVTVIDVDRVLLEKILPGPADLDYLAHVRQLKTLSVDIDPSYLTSLKACELDQTRPAAEVFAVGRYMEFRVALKRGGIRLSAQCSIRCRKNGNRTEWVLTNQDNGNQFVARKDTVKSAAGRVDNVLNVFTSDAELGIVVANRLPTPNGSTTVHLVSLEARYDKKTAAPACPNGPQPDFARFVSLKNWSFSCTRSDRTFKEIVLALDKDLLRLQSPEGPSERDAMLANRHKGFVPLPHYLRKGDKTVSLYHSPLLPLRNTERLYGLSGPAQVVAEGEHPTSPSQHGGWFFDGDDQYWIDRSAGKKFRVTPCFGKHPWVADQLLRLDQASGVFDTTYAAAWKLGRLLAIEDKRFSVALTNWKRTCAQHGHRTRQAEIDLHLYTPEHPDLISSLAPPPPEVSGWFDRRNLLKGLPFNYLVPDSRMLPAESIRFFEVDPLWTDCLLDGAFSLGRVTETDHQQDFQHIIADNRYPRMSGLLLRSEVVSGWPGLLIDAYCKLPSNVELSVDDAGRSKSPEDMPRLRRAMEAIGLPLPRAMNIELSDDYCTWTLNDLDTNPDYVDTVLSVDGVEPQPCLMMPDRDRQYRYTIVNEGKLPDRELYLKLPLLRQDRLAAGVLLCLFHGAVERIDIHLKPETLHSGLKSESNAFSKDLKGESGEMMKPRVNFALTEEFWNTGKSEPIGGAVLDIKKIADKIELMMIKTIVGETKPETDPKASNSARFALQMMEGNELVRFTVRAPN